MNRETEDLLPFVSRSTEETRELGRRLAQALARPWVLALYGPMGAGKTQLVKGLAEGLGIAPDEVTSPTFTIVHEYRRFERALVHIDAYRIESLRERDALGLDELFYSDRSCVVEWPERVEDLLPPDTVRIELSHAGPTERRIRLIGE